MALFDTLVLIWFALRNNIIDGGCGIFNCRLSSRVVEIIL